MRKEKFGKFVLLEPIETSGLGTEFRAAKLGSAGLEKLVAVLRLSPKLSANAAVAKHLMEHAKVAAQLQSPNISRILGIGKVDNVYYISREFIEGKSLRAILARCRRESFPFSFDHSLLIASKVCSALEVAHARKSESGRYFHGLVHPGNIVVSYEGEVRVFGFGYWPSGVREAGALLEAELAHLAPEQRSGAAQDHRCDIFAVGALLFETLTGEVFDPGSAGAASALLAAKLLHPAGDDDALPPAIVEILARSLASEPSARYGEMLEMRKAIDTLLFSGDFTPTTFNLAFFMHSLFRDDIDRESKILKEEREASYLEYLGEAAGPKQAASVVLATPLPVPTPAPGAKLAAAAPAPVPATVEPEVSAHPELAAVSERDAAAGFTFDKVPAKRARAPLLAGALALALVCAFLAWWRWGGAVISVAPTPPPVTTLSPDAVAALQRVKELEERLQAIEAEKAAAEQLAADEARKKLEAQAKALGTTADPAAVAKAQEEASRAARLEQERKQQEERRRLEEAKAAEEARAAEDRRRAEDAAAAAIAAAATTTTTTTLPPTTTVPPTTLAAVSLGSLVNLSDAGVIPPVPDRTPPLIYPPIALRQRIEGTVELNILVDERGIVADVQVAQGTGRRDGLDAAAIENAKRRRYRPATKDGVAVKVWIPIRVQFKLPT